MESALRDRVRTVPAKPGVYLFHDARGDVLYVGKARSLKHRVSQYLTPTRLDPAKRELVARAEDVETIVTKNDTEALALEATLIQRHDPPYNVRLVDDSSYLYLRISNETYPKVELVRRVQHDGAWYRGPFPVASAIRTTLREARKLFPWCEYGGRMPVARRQTPETGLKPCFAYHLGLCPGICARAVSLEEYQRIIAGLKRFLDGDVGSALRDLRARMAAASAASAYERAASLRDAIRAIERATTPQHAVTPRRDSVDALGLAHTGTHAVVAVLSARQGRVVGVRTFPLVVPSDEPSQDILRGFLLAYLPRSTDGAKELLLPMIVEDAALFPSMEPRESARVHGDARMRGDGRANSRRLPASPGASPHLRAPPRISAPQRGWKRRLLELARANAEEALRRTAAELSSPGALAAALKDLASALHLAHSPRRIEAYDISNIQGALPTASMVVFVDGKPRRSAYRKFKIAFGETPNDVAMMKEVLRRRFEHHRGSRGSGVVRHPRPSEWPLPDLIILDGGKGQLNAGLAVLKERGLDIPLAALAKREEELFVPSGTGGRGLGVGKRARRADTQHPTPDTLTSIRLLSTSSALFLLQRLRDEAHRFTLGYHQLLRKKRMTKSILEEIPGVGDATRKKLLRAFGSLKAIRETSGEELTTVVGPRLADALRASLGKGS